MLATIWNIIQPIMILVSVIKKLTLQEKGHVMDKLVKNLIGPDSWLLVPFESPSFCDVQIDRCCMQVLD